MKHLARHRKPKYLQSEDFNSQLTRLSFNIIWLSCAVIAVFLVVGITSAGFKPQPVPGQPNLYPDPGATTELEWQTYPSPSYRNRPTTPTLAPPTSGLEPVPSKAAAPHHLTPPSVSTSPVVSPPTVAAPQPPIPQATAKAPSPSPSPTCKPKPHKKEKKEKNGHPSQS